MQALGNDNGNRVHSVVSKFDVNVVEQASFILWYTCKEKSERYSTEDSCLDALNHDPGLYQALKVAHQRRDYEILWKKHSAPKSAAVNDLEVQSDLDQFILDLTPTITKLVIGEISLPTWRPSIPGLETDIKTHLRKLHIPLLKGKPNLLLHNLGSFQHDWTLQKRVENIFMSNNHTFLVNTSGSGKTRLLLEGLCENWGFYFTSLVDSSLLGSSDVQNSIQTHVPDSPGFHTKLPPAGYESALNVNREIAGRVFRQVFLARLIVFNLFAETMNENCPKDKNNNVFKERWLLLQLQPSFVHPQVWDIFDTLSCKLSRASDSYINNRTKTLLARVRHLCANTKDENTPSPSHLSTSDTAQTPLFCVLDEAQYAATQHSSAFRSDRHGADRPILREIVRAWENQSFGQGVFMVVAGTGISKDVVDQAVASAIMKDSRYRWCSDTGAFDQVDVQRRYLLKYFPPNFAKTKSGTRLLERIWHWLHGRHRFTAGFLSELLVNGFRRPHGLLNAYVKHFAQFDVTDGQAFVKDEDFTPLPALSQYKLDFAKLKKNDDMLSTIHQCITHYFMRSVLPGPLGKDEATYVEYGFARFVDSDTKTVVIDEPLVLLAAMHWINFNHRSSYKYFAKSIHIHDPASNGFENYVAFCIDLIFSQKRLIKEVFDFISGPPPWANQEAELVALHRTALGDIEESFVRHFQFSGPSVTLGTNAKTPEKTSSWLKHHLHAPICFPHSSMGPDLIFVLRLADGSFIWVALQAKYSLGLKGHLSRPFLRHAMRSVTPSSFFLDKDGKHYSPTTYPDLVNETSKLLSALPHKREDAGRYSLLRVIASFPADTCLKRGKEEDPDREGHPLASLNMNLIKQVTKRLSPADFLQRLQVANPPQGNGKRKRGVTETHRTRTKFLKLN